MSNYRVRSTGEVKSQGQLRKDNPNVSLPKVWSENVNEALGIDPVLESPKPEPSADYKSVVHSGVEQDANGNWVYAWTEVDMFIEYTDDDGAVITVEQQIADYEAQKLLSKRQGLSATNENLRLKLDQIGVYGVMSAAVATLDAKAEFEGVDVTPYAIHWGFATTINRLDPWVTEVAEAAGITDEQLDDLFENA
jgi:hypothetical protein